MGTMGGDACAYDGYVVFNGTGGLLYHNPKSLYRQIPLLRLPFLRPVYL